MTSPSGRSRRAATANRGTTLVGQEPCTSLLLSIAQSLMPNATYNGGLGPCLETPFDTFPIVNFHGSITPVHYWGLQRRSGINMTTQLMLYWVSKAKRSTGRQENGQMENPTTGKWQNRKTAKRQNRKKAKRGNNRENGKTGKRENQKNGKAENGKTGKPPENGKTGKLENRKTGKRQNG